MRGKGMIATVGIGLLVAVALWWHARPSLEGTRPGDRVVVVPSATAPAPGPATQSPMLRASRPATSVESAGDAIAIGPYRTAVTRTLGLSATAVFRNVSVANQQQRIVCGEVRDGSAGNYRPFVYVGSASIAALDDGSPDFRQMQSGACRNSRQGSSGS